MLSKIANFFRSELSDPAVQRGVIVVISMLAVKFGLKYGVDRSRADVLATAVWSFLTIAVARMPGKGQS